MTKVIIDQIEYDSEDMSEQAKSQLTSLQFCNAELTRLNHLVAATTTARDAYAMALKSALSGSDEVKDQLDVESRLGETITFD